MILSLGDDATADLFHGRRTHRIRKFPPAIIPAALRKLDLLNAADRINDLRAPPSNRLEKLKGNRKGLYSIRINDQYRICFDWNEKDTYNVEIIDYH